MGDYNMVNDNNSTPLFCPNCGHPVSPDDAFCENCGYNLKEFFSKLNDEKNQQNSQGQQPQTAESNRPVNSRPTPKSNASSKERDSNPGPQKNYSSFQGQQERGGRQPRPQPPFQQRPRPQQPRPGQKERVPSQPRKKLARWKIILAVVVVILIVGGYLFGKNYYSRVQTLNRLTNQIRTEKGLTPYFYTADPSLKITNQNLQPMASYYGRNMQALSQFKSQLSAKGVTADRKFSYQQNGNKWLIFPNFQVKISPVYPAISTNHPNVDLKLNGSAIATSSGSTYTKKLGPLVPGEYTLEANGTVNNKQIDNKGTYYINSNKDYLLKLETISFTVSSAPKAVIYLNGKQQGTTDSSGNLSLNNVPFSSELNLTAKYHLPSGIINSTPVNISDSDDGTVVDIAFPGTMTFDQASKLLKHIFSGFESMYSDSDYGSDEGVANYFVGGTSNSAYAYFPQHAKAFNKDDKLNGFSVSPTVTSVVPNDNQETVVNFNVKYTFNYDGHDNIQMFKSTAIVKKVNGQFKMVSRTTNPPYRNYNKKS